MSAGRGPVPIISFKPPIVGETLILDEVVADVSSQLDAQAELGVQIRREHSVPDTGPTNRGLWYQIPEVTAVFADLKGSTGLNANDGARTAAYAYTYFIRAMTVIMERFSRGIRGYTGGWHIRAVQWAGCAFRGGGLCHHDEDPD